MVQIKDPAAFPQCFHGTYLKCIIDILATGLSKMDRLHVHMSKGLFGEVVSGYRKNCEVLIEIDVTKAMNEGCWSFLKVEMV